MQKEYWANIIKEFYESTIQIGGEGLIVEIDESKFVKRKYNKCHKV